MICERCGTYMPDDALTCDHCGTLLSPNRARETGVRAMRQGRVNAIPPALNDERRDGMPEYGDYEMSPLPLEQERSPRRKVAKSGLNSFASRPTTRRGVPVNPHGRVRQIASRSVKTHHVRRHTINWMLIGMIGVAVLILAVGGYLFYMKGTDEGQRITARQVTASVTEDMLALARTTDDQNREARDIVLKELTSVPAQTYWLVGQEYMDIGDVEMGIQSFRVADLLDPENYDGMLLLANALELNEQDDRAETLYLKMCADISPSRPESYTALIRMYQEQDRGPEAADMMKLAYENTDRESYRLQRKDFIPLTPQVDLTAGRYMLTQTVTLTSPQGYDIYYTLDDAAELPEGGTYTEDGALSIPEGTLTLRAVCVSGDLVSDELAVTYIVYYPTPKAPGVNLAPNTYDKPRAVSLRSGEGEEKEELVYYYTIDGSTPTLDSPVYDGTPIQMPSGRVTLKAVVVNQYGKMSSIKEVGYKFNTKPGPLEPFKEEDRFSGFALNETDIQTFKEKIGQPKSETETKYLSLENEARHLEYDWGYAVFILEGSKWQLVRVEMNSQIASGPRGVGFGSSESEITGVYKDMGQPQSPSGNRGLYNEDPTIGKVIQNADGTRTVQYECNTLASKHHVLQYHLKNNRVYQIVHYYLPR